MKVITNLKTWQWGLSGSSIKSFFLVAIAILTVACGSSSSSEGPPPTTPSDVDTKNGPPPMNNMMTNPPGGTNAPTPSPSTGASGGQ